MKNLRELLYFRNFVGGGRGGGGGGVGDLSFFIEIIFFDFCV